MNNIKNSTVVANDLLIELLLAIGDKKITAKIRTIDYLKRYGKDDTLTQIYYKEYKDALNTERKLEKVLFPSLYH